MSESAKVVPTTVAGTNSAAKSKSDSDLCWQKVIQINLEARQQASSSEGVSSNDYDALSSLPSVGYSTSNASSVNNTVSSKKVSSEVIVVSDEESPTSPDSGGLKLNTNMNEVSNIAHHQVSNNSSTSAEVNDPSVQALKELLQKEEKKLSVLKTIHGLQGAVTTTKNTSSIQGSALNKSSGRPSGSGSGRNSPNFRASSQNKHSIVVVPGIQAAKSSSSISSSSGSNMSTGISSRLQQLVDNIAADQALTSCSDRILSSTGGKASGLQNKLVTLSAPPIPGLTSILSSNNSQKQHNTITLSSEKLLQFASANNIPQLLRPKTTRSSTHEIITISDSPMGAAPPPLLSSASSRVPMTNGSIQVHTISSTAIPRVSSVSSNDNKKNYTYPTSENSRRYRDYILKQNHAKRNFQKQIERKMVVAPYPKTFRQVWPLIPVYDSTFVRNFGMEAVMHYFDPNSKANQEKTNSKVKPVCNQCGCDFASAWQIRKSNSKQLLLCEACDFQNLKILQRSKLGNQLKELLESIKKDEEKFGIEFEETRKQALNLEKQKAAERPPPLTSQLTTSKPTSKVVSALGHVNQVVLNSQVSNRVQALAASEGKTADVPSSASNQQCTIVIPSILGQRTQSPNIGTKKREAPTTGGQSDVAPPPSKVYKPGSTLDLTLNRLSKQLIKRKLDEKRQEYQEYQEQEKMVVETETEASGFKMEGGINRDTTSPSPTPGGGEGRKAKSRRKGTPKHKRLLSSSSIGSE